MRIINLVLFLDMMYIHVFYVLVLDFVVDCKGIKSFAKDNSILILIVVATIIIGIIFKKLDLASLDIGGVILGVATIYMLKKSVDISQKSAESTEKSVNIALKSLEKSMAVNLDANLEFETEPVSHVKYGSDADRQANVKALELSIYLCIRNNGSGVVNNMNYEIITTKEKELKALFQYTFRSSFPKSILGNQSCRIKSHGEDFCQGNPRVNVEGKIKKLIDGSFKDLKLKITYDTESKKNLSKTIDLGFAEFKFVSPVEQSESEGKLSS